MKFLFSHRFNLIDMVGCAALSVLVSTGQLLMALVVGIIMASISAISRCVITFHLANRQWQRLVDEQPDYLIPAIKKHRELFGSTLKDAYEVVVDYRDKPSNKK